MSQSSNPEEETTRITLRVPRSMYEEIEQIVLDDEAPEPNTSEVVRASVREFLAERNQSAE